MQRQSLFLTLCIVILLSACSPGAFATSTSIGTEVSGTAVAATVSVGTASVVTVVPGFSTPYPPDFTPQPTRVPPTPTGIPTLPNGLNPSELKYKLLEAFPNFFFCDPDYYPIAREDETTLALQHFAEIQANSEEFNAILAHNDLPISASYTDEQKLLIYREHKKLAAIHFELDGNLYRFLIVVSDGKESGEAVSGSIDGQGKVDVLERKPTIATCPICLAEGTLIDTPSGSVAVQDLRAGMLVWTVDQGGTRVARPVLSVGKTVVPLTHEVVHVVLEDGRQVWVSPGHPTADGRQVGELKMGDTLDGSVVQSAQLERYAGYATYDLLPAGETGEYWANGILLGSTLTGER